MLVKTAILTWLMLLFVVDDVYGRPAVDLGADPLSVCYSLKCPKDTTMCGKRSEISEDDRSKLLVQIRCYNGLGTVLKSRNLTEENPFGPHVYYKGTRFSAVIRLSPSDTEDENPEDTEGEKEFNLLPSYPTTRSGPKSEVEDLNNK